MAAEIPVEISNDETIVRGICSPYHLKKGKIKPQAFSPTPNTDEVSVMRHTYLGSDFCKAKARELINASENKTYKGFAVLSALKIRATGCDVIDSRHVYLGHADIKLGIIATADEPLPAEQLSRLHSLRKALLDCAHYIEDPDPDAEKWTGLPIIPKG